MLSSEEKRARLQKALDYGGNTHDLADVIDLVRKGEAQFWESGDGSILTEIHTFPRLKTVHYWLISGGLKDCLALDRDIVPWALEQGCTVATATGRKGWGKVAAPLGWKPYMFTFHKPLTED